MAKTITHKYPRIVVTPPGPKARELLKRDTTTLSQSLVRWYPLVAESGQGCIVKDVDGNEFIDFNSGIAVLNVGHSHPRIVSAIKDQAEKLTHYSYTDFYYEPIVRMGEELTKITPGTHPKQVFFGNSGAEAVEAAMKVTRWHTRRQLFLAFGGSFHGRTMGALSLTASKPVQRRHFSPLVPGVSHVPYPYCYRCPLGLSYPECGVKCADYIEEEVLMKSCPPEDTAAMFVEPVQGEGGYVVPPPDYFQKLKRILDKYGILLVDDEIQSGMGRTGKWCAIDHWDVVPDVVCFAKALGAGLPLGAMVARADIMDWEGGTHATTFGGNPVACRAGIEVVNVIREERLLENATKQGQHLMKRLREIQEDCELIGDVRGKGLMAGAELVKDRKTKQPASEEAKATINKCFKRGLAIITSGKSAIRFAPPLIIDRELLDAGIDVFEEVVKEVAKEAS
jgi:4-aminobutyrate aminotransferase